MTDLAQILRVEFLQFLNANGMSYPIKKAFKNAKSFH